MDGAISSSETFVLKTNHDTDTKTQKYKDQNAMSSGSEPLVTDYVSLFEDTNRRHSCIVKKWNDHVEKHKSLESPFPAISELTLKKWMSEDPTNNEQTHFCCIMDPKTGNIIWKIRGEGTIHRAR